MKRGIICVCLCLALVLAALPGLSESGDERMLMAGFDGENTGRSWDGCAFFDRMAELTGVSFRFQQYDSRASWEQAKQAMRPGGELPDVLFKAGLTRSQMQAMYDAGVLMDLSGLIDRFCPNLSALLNAHPEYRDQLALPGGQIVALPYISSAPAQNAMWINKTWLDRLKLDAPTDRESLEAVLEAFLTKDPNRNGRQDEIPLSFLGPFDLKFLSHAFGITANDYNLYLDEAGKVHFAPLEAEYRAFVEWLRDLFKKRYLDQNGFLQTDTMRTVTKASQAQTCGIVLTTELTSLFPAEWAQDYVILMPLSCGGKTVYRSLTGPVYQGAFALTTACRDPEKALAFADRLYTLEGAKLMAVGKENEDYVIDGDGTWRMLPSVTQDSTFVSRTLIVDGSTPPGISADEFELSYTESYVTDMIRQRIRLNEYCALPFPKTDLPSGAKERVAELQMTLGYLTDMQLARWIMGEDELTDETFEGFRRTLSENGLDEFLAIWQDAV